MAGRYEELLARARVVLELAADEVEGPDWVSVDQPCELWDKRGERTGGNPGDDEVRCVTVLR